MASTPGRPASGGETWGGSGSSSSSTPVGLRTASSSLGDGHVVASTPTPQRPGPGVGAARTRARKSNLPDIGTPIKVASSSPYRTPESTSKAAMFLSRTPFGTPARSQATPAATPSQAAPSGSAYSASQRAPSQAPVKPVTGVRPQIWALSKSLLDGGSSYTTLALQSRPHLPFSSLVSTALRANWARLGAMTLVTHHALFSLALYSPSQPLKTATLAFRPVVIALSSMAYAGMLACFLAMPGHPLSTTQRQWRSSFRVTLQDSKVAGTVLPAASPAGIIQMRTQQSALWRSMLLHALLGLCLAGMHVLGLIYYSPNSYWLPYNNVQIRLSSGHKTTVLRPNERFFLLIAGNVALCALFAFLRSMHVSSPHVTPGTPFAEPKFQAQAPLATANGRIASRLAKARRAAVLAGLLGPPLILATYLAVRRPFFRLVLSLIGHHSPLRPLLIPSFRRPLLNSELMYRSSLLGLASVLFLEFFDAGWEVFATQPIEGASGGLSRFAREPTRSLIRTMQQRRQKVDDEGASLGPLERDYYAHFAFAEMALLASTDVERRRAIFRDVGGAGTSIQPDSLNTKSAWAQIATECLEVLREERQWIASRGKDPGGNAAVVGTVGAGGAQPRLKHVDSVHQITVSSGADVVKNRPASVWDRLASSVSTDSAPHSNAAVRHPTSGAVPGAGMPSPGTGSSTAVQAEGDGGLNSLLHRLAPATSTPPASAPPSAAARGSGAAAAQGSVSNPTQPTRAQMSAPTAIAVELAASIAITSWRALCVLYGRLPSDMQHVLAHSHASQIMLSTTMHWLGGSLGGASSPASDRDAAAAATLLCSGTVPRDAALATWSVQTLSALLAASLDQDEYGTVALSVASHCGVDDVLEAFGALLIALQNLATALNSSGAESNADGNNATDSATTKDPRAHTRADAGRAAFDQVAGPLVVALRSGITLVVGAFEPTGMRLRPSCRALVDKALAAPAP